MKITSGVLDKCEFSNLQIRQRYVTFSFGSVPSYKVAYTKPVHEIMNREEFEYLKRTEIKV